MMFLVMLLTGYMFVTVELIVLSNGSTLSDDYLNQTFSIFESEKQLFIFNTCYAATYIPEFSQNGRMILASTSVDGMEYVDLFGYHTPFYETIKNYWDWNQSVEENFITLCTILEDDPVLYDFDMYTDFFI